MSTIGELLANPMSTYMCEPVLVPQMDGTGLPPVTMNMSSLHLLSVPSGCANTKFEKSSLEEQIDKTERKCMDGLSDPPKKCIIKKVLVSLN